MSATTNITSLANDYIDDMANHYDGDRDSFFAVQRDFFRKNASHLGDCFTDTSSWAEGEAFTQQEFEAEIVRIIMDGQAW